MEYLKISGKYPLLSKQEEIELGRRIQKWLTWTNGECPKSVVRSGQRAREKFVLANLRLVIKAAKGYSRRLHGTGLTFEDLLQEGVFGLQRAAEKYSPECGYAYSTYAMWWVRQSISRVIEMKGGMIRLSSGARRKLRRFRNGEMEELTPRDTFTLRQAALCEKVTALDALNLQDVI